MPSPLAFYILAQYGIPQSRFDQIGVASHNNQTGIFNLKGQFLSNFEFEQRGYFSNNDQWAAEVLQKIPYSTPNQTSIEVFNGNTEANESLAKMLSNARNAAINIAKNRTKFHYLTTGQQFNIQQLIIKEFWNNGIYYFQVGIQLPYDEIVDYVPDQEKFL